MKKRGLTLISLLASLPMLGGCVERRVDGSSILFEYSWWVIPVMLLIGVVVTIGAVVVLRTHSGPRMRKVAWVGIIAGPLLLFTIPSSRIPLELGSEGFTSKTGLWFDVQHHELLFNVTERIDIISKRVIGSRIATIELVCLHENGSVLNIPVGDQLQEALPDIVRLGMKSGVLVRDLR